MATSASVTTPGNTRFRLAKQTGALLSTTLLNGVLGALFWLLAARFASRSAVALAIAVQSLLLLLSVVAQLNLGTALSRFVPAAGSSQGATVRFSYIIAISAGLVVGACTVGIGVLRGGQVVSGADYGLVLLLGAAVPLWTAFALQDAALVACNKAGWIPVENGTAAILRLALLAPLAATGGAGGIFLAFVLPAVPMVLAVSWALRSFLERGGDVLPNRAGLIRYAMADYPGGLAGSLAYRAVPVLALAVLAPQDAAYIGLPWNVLVVVLSTLPMLSRALLTEMSTPGVDVYSVFRRTERLLVGGLLPCCAVGVVLVRPVLAIAGAGYVVHGSSVLVGGILAVVPAAASEARMALLRYFGRPGAATFVGLGRAALLLICALVLAQTGRLVLLGWGLLLVYTLAWATSQLLTRGLGIP